MPATGRGMSDHAAAWRGARELNPYAFTALRLCAYASPPTYSKEVIPEFVRGQRGQKPLDISGITATPMASIWPDFAQNSIKLMVNAICLGRPAALGAPASPFGHAPGIGRRFGRG